MPVASPATTGAVLASEPTPSSEVFYGRGFFIGPLCAENGAPEGDPFSVAAMAGICFFVDRVLQDSQLCFRSYVDNWSWTFQDFPRALRAINVLQVPVDWRKSYAWASSVSARKWWHDQGAACFPAEVQVQVVTNVKELGACNLGTALT